MAERDVVVDKIRLTYEGIFKVTDLYRLIDNFFRDRGYDKRERRNIENVKADGKYIELELEPWKKITDYAQNVIQLRIIMSNVTDAHVKKDGVDVKLNKGKIQIVLSAYIETDYEGRWEGKPLLYFLRTVFNKFIFKPYTEGYEKNVLADLNELYSMIKNYLNTYKMPTPAVSGVRDIGATYTP